MKTWAEFEDELCSPIRECELCGEQSDEVPVDRVEERGQHGIVYEWRCRAGYGCQDPAMHDEASYQGEVLT